MALADIANLIPSLFQLFLPLLLVAMLIFVENRARPIAARALHINRKALLPPPDYPLALGAFSMTHLVPIITRPIIPYYLFILFAVFAMSIYSWGHCTRCKPQTTEYGQHWSLCCYCGVGSFVAGFVILFIVNVVGALPPFFFL